MLQLIVRYTWVIFLFAAVIWLSIYFQGGRQKSVYLIFGIVMLVMAVAKFARRNRPIVPGPGGPPAA
jgi:hypothetical protein